MVELMHNYSNLYCDLSAGSGLNALKRNREFARRFLIEFQDRCLFGRDQFGNELQTYLNSLQLPQDVLSKFIMKTLCEFFHRDKRKNKALIYLKYLIGYSRKVKQWQSRMQENLDHIHNFGALISVRRAEGIFSQLSVS